MMTDLSQQLRWNNRFARLGEKFYTRLNAQALPNPYWISRNQAVARELGIEESWFQSHESLNAFAGNSTLLGSDPLASLSLVRLETTTPRDARQAQSLWPEATLRPLLSRLKQPRHSQQRQLIALRAEAGDDAAGGLRDIGTMSKALAPMDIRNMHF